MTVQHPPTWSARISWIKRIGMPATNNLILEKSLGTIYLSLCIWKIFGGESGFWNNNWNHPLKDKHLFHLFLNKRNRDLFLRRAPGGSFFETFHKRCRRRRRRCSVQVSFSWLPPDHNVRQYPIEQSLFFFLPLFRCCVHNETFGLALRIFFKKTKNGELYFLLRNFLWAIYTSKAIEDESIKLTDTWLRKWE
jgi:hypothetical protein